MQEEPSFLHLRHSLYGRETHRKGNMQSKQKKHPFKDGGCQQHIHRRSLLALQTWKPQEQHEKLYENVSIRNSHQVSVKLQKRLFQICVSLTKCRLLHSVSSIASGTGSSLHFIFIIVALSHFSALFFTYSSIIPIYLKHFILITL